LLVFCQHESTLTREMEAFAIPQVRNFNRTVTEAIGALDDRFLGRLWPLALGSTVVGDRIR
jgi:hypothetical protein